MLKSNLFEKKHNNKNTIFSNINMEKPVQMFFSGIIAGMIYIGLLLVLFSTSYPGLELSIARTTSFAIGFVLLLLAFYLLLKVGGNDSSKIL